MPDWTVLQLARTTAGFLAERGVDNPRLDAEILLAQVLGFDRTQLYMNADWPVGETEREAYRELIRRRASGEPVAYIVGSRGFWSLDLRVDARVLIPRPETERVVELALAFAGTYAHDAWRIVDVGTGSGALALALAAELSEAVVLATDISADALEVARDNADDHGLRERVRFVRADLLASLVDRPESVDIVVSNPPYVGRHDGQALDPSVAAHEPQVALFSGDDGLDAIRRLVPQAAAALVPGGLFLCEIGAGQGAAATALASEAFAEVSIERDYSGLDRVLCARKQGTPSWEPVSRAPSETPDDISAGEGSAPEEPAPEDIGAQLLAEAEAAELPIIDLRDR